MGLHVGVVSSHGHEDGHILVWDKLPEVESIHVCTIAGEANLDAISSLSPKVVSKNRGLTELLSRPLDAVGVCVRPDLGPPTLRTIVDAGVPVLFDKPASTRAADMREVAELAASRGVTAGTMFQWRYSASILEARRALAEGGLGELYAVEMRMLTSQLRYRRPRTNYLFRSEYAGSGILSWLGCHLLDSLNFITGDHIVEVTAMTGNQNPEPVDVEDTAMVAFRMAGGAMGTLHAGYLMAGPGKNPDDSLIALLDSVVAAQLRRRPVRARLLDVERSARMGDGRNKELHLRRAPLRGIRGNHGRAPLLRLPGGRKGRRPGPQPQ